MRVPWLVVLFIFVLATGASRAAAQAPVRPVDGGAPWTAAQTAALGRDLDAMLARAPAVHGAHVGVELMTTGGSALYERHAGDWFQPASSFKLLVGSVALERLGPGYRFRTTLARAPAVAPATGDVLILHGGGDPLLRAADLDAAAGAALRAGVSGPVDLRVDTARVSSAVRKGYGWQFDDVLAPYAPVVNGLPFDENVLAGWLDPAPTLGAPATLRLAPPFAPVLLAPDACPGGPTLLTFAVSVTTEAAGRDADVDVTPGRCGEIDLRGTIPQGHPTSLAMAVDAPESLARLALAAALERRGVAVAPAAPATAGAPLPGIRDVPAAALPGESVLWSHEGTALAALLGPDFWWPSDNLVAEQLLYELAAAGGELPATLAGATRVEQGWLRGIGVDPAQVEIADGSGLSQYDRITPRILAAILRYDWSGPNRDAVLDALPVLGVRGDIGSFGAGSPAAGRVFAKGGSMMHVRSMAGYVSTATHGTAIFVLSVDDWMGDEAALDAFRSAFCAQITGR